MQQDALVVHLCKMSPRSSVASVRIARLLSSMMIDAPIMDRPIINLPMGTPWKKSWKWVFIVNSPSAFCDFIDELVEICKNAENIVWVMNDYKIYPPTQLRRYLYDTGKKLQLWGTLPRIPDRLRKLKAYGNLPEIATKVINWNALTFTPSSTKTTDLRNGLVYWGAFRHEPSRQYEGRREYFRRYLNFPFTWISTTKKGQSKFAEILPVVPAEQILDPFESVVEEIASWPATLYIEDKFSHEVFCQPANRFYEALAAGVAMYVEPNAARTLSQAGFMVTEDLGLIKDPEDLARRINHDPLQVAIRQRRAWNVRDYRMEMIGVLKRALEDEGL